MLKCFLTVSVIAIPVMYQTQVFAQGQGGDPVAGRALAGHICAECHLIDGTHSRSLPRGPTFKDLAERRGNSTERIRRFLRKPHGEMPEIPLKPNEIEDLVSYILALGE